MVRDSLLAHHPSGEFFVPDLYATATAEEQNKKVSA